MSELQVYCPLDIVPITPKYCSETYSVQWLSDGMVYAKFIPEYSNLQMIAFDFEAVTNNGSNIVVNLIYVVEGVSVIAQTYNLGTLSSPTRKYHYFDTGGQLMLDTTEITFEIVTSNGTSGEISITLDCEVDVASQDFCFVPDGTNPQDVCLNCNTTRRVYWEQTYNGVLKLNFSYGTWYKDPELQTPADCGFYKANAPNATIWRVCGGGPIFEATCDSSKFECFETSTRTHNAPNYKFSNPYLPGAPFTPQNTFKYSVLTSTLELDDDSPTNFDVVLRYTANTADAFQVVGFTISDANVKSPDAGAISFSTSTLPDTFVSITNDTLLVITAATKELRVKLNVNTNSSFKTKSILFRHFVGNRVQVTPGTVITSVYADCSTKNPTYIYSGGVHPYSSYDSLINPKTFTYLYSLTPISSWNKGTRVFCDWSLAQPAYPWYYGIQGKSYKVGEPFKREYGSILVFEVKTSEAKRFAKSMGWAKENYKVTQKIVGPKNWGNISQSPACIEPVMISGIITKIINQANLVQPTSYVYFMGWSDSGFLPANDDVFTIYDWANNVHIPCTGFEHAITKVAPAYVAGLPPEVRKYATGISNTPLALQSAAALGFVIASFYVYKAIPVLFLGKKVLYMPWYLGGGGCVSGATIGTAFLWSFILGVIAIAILLLLFFVNSKKVIAEQCKQFKKVYSTTPYIELGNFLFQRNENTPGSRWAGYLCDGAYFYGVTNDGIVTQKSLSYTFKRDKYVYSILPDKPSYVTEPAKLFFLSYTAGRPTFYPNN